MAGFKKSTDVSKKEKKRESKKIGFPKFGKGKKDKGEGNIEKHITEEAILGEYEFEGDQQINHEMEQRFDEKAENYEKEVVAREEIIEKGAKETFISYEEEATSADKNHVEAFPEVELEKEDEENIPIQEEILNIEVSEASLDGTEEKLAKKGGLFGRKEKKIKEKKTKEKPEKEKKLKEKKIKEKPEKEKKLKEKKIKEKPEKVKKSKEKKPKGKKDKASSKGFLFRLSKKKRGNIESGISSDATDIISTEGGLPVEKSPKKKRKFKIPMPAFLKKLGARISKIKFVSKWLEKRKNKPPKVKVEKVSICKMLKEAKKEKGKLTFKDSIQIIKAGLKKKKELRESVTGEFKRVEKVAFYRGIQVKLWSIVLIPIIFLIALGVVSTSKASKGIKSTYSSSLTQSIEITADYYDFIFSTVRSNYNALLKESGLKAYVNGVMNKMGDGSNDKFRNELYKQFITDKKDNKFLKSVYVLTDDDKVISTNGVEKDMMMTELLTTEQGTEAMEDDINGFYYYGAIPSLDGDLNTTTDEYAVRMMRKVTDSGSEEDNLLGGIIVLDLTKEEIQNVIGKFNPSDGSIVALVTRDGQEIYGPDVTVEEGKKNFVGQDFYTQSVAELEGLENEKLLQKNVEFNGRDYFFVLANIGDTKCSICYMIPQAVIDEQASDIKDMTVYMVIISIIVAGIIGLIVAQGMSGTISSILKQIKKVSQGDLTVRVHTKRKDEFAVLATGISDMIAHTKHLIQKVEVVSTELTDISQQVIESSEAFLKSSQAIEGSVGEIEIGTTTQAEHSVDCLEEMDKLSKRIEVVSDNTNKISDITNETNSSIQSGMESMEILNEKSKSTAEITNVVIEGIESLEEKSKSIGKIIGAINDIASETNLLSLNASIEAARAGAAGRGFSVVATEIRKLADQSMLSANEIQDIVSEITNNTKYVVQTAKQADSIVQEQQEAVNETMRAFKLMKKQISVLMSELQSILVGVKEMEETRHITLGAIEEISAVSEETAAATTEVSNMVTKQLGVVEELSENSEHLSSSAEDLSNAINQFIIR